MLPGNQPDIVNGIYRLLFEIGKFFIAQKIFFSFEKQPDTKGVMFSIFAKIFLPGLDAFFDLLLPLYFFTIKMLM